MARNANGDAEIPDGHVFTQPWPATQAEKARGRRDKVIYYQYRADRPHLRGTDEQVAKAERAVAGKTPVKRNRFIRLSGGDKSVNRTLETKTPRPGRAEGLHHQPREPRPGVRDQRRPPGSGGTSSPSG